MQMPNRLHAIAYEQYGESIQRDTTSLGDQGPLFPILMPERPTFRMRAGGLACDAYTSSFQVRAFACFTRTTTSIRLRILSAFRRPCLAFYRGSSTKGDSLVDGRDDRSQAST